MSSFGFVKDVMNNLANNRQLLKGKRDRHANNKKAYSRRTRYAGAKPAPKSQRVDHKALNAVKARVGKTRIFEMWAFSIMALAIIALVVWLFWV